MVLTCWRRDGRCHGVPVVVTPEGVSVSSGKLDRARALVHTFHGPVLDQLPRDVNWLLTLQCVLEAALAVADREVVGKATRLRTPYYERAVFNAGAVMFHGVTDDTLAPAAALLGDPDQACCLRARALATCDASAPRGGKTGSRRGGCPRLTTSLTGRAGCTCIQHRAGSGSSGRTRQPRRSGPCVVSAT